MESSFRLGRIAGIEIGVHWTWLLAFAIVTIALERQFAESYTRWSPAVAWATAAAGAIALFVCVLLHELSHALVARARGMPVGGITLFIFGGVTAIEGEAAEPANEFLMAVVGPLTSLALAAGAWFLLGVTRQGCNPLLPSFANRGCQPLGALLFQLAFMNLALGVFNLIPGFPLDGGRVLRSLLWGALGDFGRATRIAARLGQVLAYLMIAAGVWISFNGGFLNGIWLALIGWFLLNAAEASYRQGAAPRAAPEPPPPTVQQLMRAPVLVPPAMSVRALVEQVLLARGGRAALVAEDGRALGLISLSDVQRVPRHFWDTTPLRMVMTPAASLVAVAPEAPLGEALRLLAAYDVNQLPVLRDGAPVGLLTRGDVLRYVQMVQEQRAPGASAAPRQHPV